MEGAGGSACPMKKGSVERGCEGGLVTVTSVHDSTVQSQVVCKEV